MPPPATVGIIGGGQLGRMIVAEARRLRYRTIVLDPDDQGPCAQVADDVVVGRHDDLDAAMELARRCDVVTIETEHVPWRTLAHIEPHTRVRPGSAVLRAVQDRLSQKRFLEEHGLPQPRFAAVEDEESLARAIERVGAPAVMKSRTGGYDGRGQARVMKAEDAQAAWASIGRTPAILEAFVPFEREVSVVLARSEEGEVRCYPLAENEHVRGVLHTTRAPARASEETEKRAREIASKIARELGIVGVMAVEMFLLPDGSVQVNEIAPRVHNSGHYTLGACPTTQFEQHLRAICGVPLGSTDQLVPAVMLNLLGDHWSAGEPDWLKVLRVPEAHLHLYGKARASPGRKMGHVTVLHQDVERAMKIARDIHAELSAGVRK